MDLQQALEQSGIAETYYDGYTAVVRDGQGENDDKLTLSIQSGGMPPHFSKDLESVEQVEQEMSETHASKPLDWTPVDPE